LDSADRAWDIMNMTWRHDVRSECLVGRGVFRVAASWSARAGGRWLLTALLVSLLAGLACRGHEGGAGVGGQSGDEGRRSTLPWLGTGGVASDSHR
jgi:hypothetical protein